MIRGMIRPRLFTVYTNIPLLRRRSSSHSFFLKGPTGPWHSKARGRYDSGYVSGMIRACTKSFWRHCLTQKLDAGFDSMTKSSRLANSIIKQMDASKHSFKIMGMIRSMIRGV